MAKKQNNRRSQVLTNLEIAQALSEVGDLLELQGGNQFKVRAYRNASRSVRNHSTRIQRLVEEDEDLTSLPGVGKDMAAHIAELVETGKLERLDKLRDEIPESLVEMMKLPDLGARKTRRLWKELGVETVDELEKAADAGRVAELEGFGKKSQQKILQGIGTYRKHQGRFKLADAEQLIEPLMDYLREDGNIQKLDVAGSYRRCKETVGDVDILAVADAGKNVMKRFGEYGQIREVRQAGDTRGTVVLASGLQVDLRIVPARSYGAALVYFTGSKDHNIKLRNRALQRDLSISEYGVFRKSGDNDDESDHGPDVDDYVTGETEEKVYDAVGLPWIPPVLREDQGEVEAAAEKDLPELVQLDDIRGDLQMHSTWSDGKNSLEEMARACRDRGYDYLAITDHGTSLPMTGGLDKDRLKKQWNEIDEMNEKFDDIRVFRSMEVDVLEDGALSLEEELLDELDIVLVSIHSKFNLSAEKQTERVLKALQHSKVNMFAHPTARLINEREPIEFDMEKALDCAAENGVVMEINAQPDRLDLNDMHVRMAGDRGVKIAINTDAHDTDMLNAMRYGVQQAQRGWLTRDDVINTRSTSDLLRLFGKK